MVGEMYGRLKSISSLFFGSGFLFGSSWPFSFYQIVWSISNYEINLPQSPRSSLFEIFENDGLLPMRIIELGSSAICFEDS